MFAGNTLCCVECLVWVRGQGRRPEDIPASSHPRSVSGLGTSESGRGRDEARGCCGPGEARLLQYEAKGQRAVLPTLHPPIAGLEIRLEIQFGMPASDKEIKKAIETQSLKSPL